MYWTIRLGIFAIVALVSLGGWVYHRMTGQRIAGVTDDDDDDDWAGSAPLVCGGNDQIDAKGVKATFTSGTAINAGGNCKVTCKDCVIKAPMGVQANGNAQIVLIGGSVEGQTAVTASGNGKVDVQGNAKVTGAVSQTGNGVITGVAAPASASAAASAPHPTASAPASHAPAGPAKPAKKK
jgi:hypothetical protein